MDEHAHAQGMAHNCSPPFAQLILQVPTRYSGDNNLQIQLIGVISRISGMSQIEQLPESVAKMYTVAERLLASARAESFGIQDTAASLLTGLIADANAVAVRNRQVGEHAFAIVGRICDEGFPTTDAEYAVFQKCWWAVRSEVTSLSFSA